MMEIVIKIPDVQYENMAKIANAGKEPLGYFERVIMCGTPLPKGHGRLIDADAVDTRYSDPEVGEILDDAPTIIEGSEAE